MAHAQFFASLPDNELKGWEQELRRILLEALSEVHGAFPLSEWIDRRIGGEVATRRTDGAHCEIVKRDMPESRFHQHPQARGGPRSAQESFFASLSPTAFSTAEQALRDAVFEFLFNWQRLELANLHHLLRFPDVCRAASNFLPKNIPMKEWIEHRIGGEIEIQPGRNGEQVIVLTDKSHMTNYVQVRRNKAMAAAAALGHHVGGRVASQCPTSPGRPPASPMPPTALPPQVANVSKEQFFNSLPNGTLLPKELALREAILSWYHRWMQNRPTNRARNFPTLSDIGGDHDVKLAKQELLPPKVRLADWIERRIGGEVVLRALRDGLHEIYLRSEGSPPTVPPDGPPEPPDPVVVRNLPPPADPAKEEFFGSLPTDEFSPAEESVREALLNFLEAWSGPNPPNIADASADDTVAACRRDLLPKGCGVSLKEWMDRRIGGEIETRAGPNGQWVFQLRDSHSSAAGSCSSGGNGAKRRRI